MKRIIENIKFMQDGTMVFGDLHLEDGFVERIDYKTPHMVSDIAIPGLVDIHTHGFHGYSCENTDIGNLHALALEYPKRGITSFVRRYQQDHWMNFVRSSTHIGKPFREIIGEHATRACIWRVHI